MSTAFETLPSRSELRPTVPRSLADLPPPHPRVKPIELVQLCYTLVHAAQAAGIHDLADGEYRPGDPTLEVGIERQLNYLLDQVGCNRPGFRLLEIGCGYGHLLRLAAARGAQAVGVNVSREQVEHCRRNGQQVYCCSYRDLLELDEWHGRFDGVIANGSLEHWVQPEDVLAGRMNSIYRESFQIAHRMLDPALPDARYVTTAIHVKREVRPEWLLAPWQSWPRGSDQRHFSLLHHWMGGYYPVDGQLEACARPYFTCEAEVDGTEGYRIANDFRMATMMWALYTNPRVVWRIARALFRHPRVTSTMIESFFIEKSWDWQFWGADPPMKLLRHTWRRNTEPRSACQ
ncbi:MAG: class I SAM-dependent methyltransferase [Planctomycetes bacterium]|nr:class I SAM-dependent methyltransferase [Planctomycetota bacterium]